MKKKIFIKELKNKLSILEESEINDIINEYETIIDDKVENGEDEEKAIADFGDIDELAKEILKAYKINPDYNKKEEKIKFENFEDFVQKGANKLTEFSKKIADDFKNDDISLEFIFEILIKAIILLVLLSILRLPFMFITFLGKSILDISIFPLNQLLIAIWYLLLWVLYIVTCVFIGIAMFKNDMNFLKKNKNIKTNKKSSKEKEEIKKDKKKIKNEYPLSNILFNIVKMFIFIFILLPLICINIGFIFSIVFVAYYVFLGINCLGILFILIGCFLFFNLIYIAIKDILKGTNHNYLLQVFVSVIFVAIGTILTINWVSDIRYVNNSNLETETTSYFYDISTEPTIYLENNYETITDNTLEDNMIKIDVNYFSTATNISKYSDYNTIRIYVNRNSFLNVYDDIIVALKNNIVYNYDDLYKANIKIYANENTISKLKIND